MLIKLPGPGLELYVAQPSAAQVTVLANTKEVSPVHTRMQLVLMCSSLCSGFC
jgi:hypothetical protein